MLMVVARLGGVPSTCYYSTLLPQHRQVPPMSTEVKVGLITALAVWTK